LSQPTFDVNVKPIQVRDRAWIAPKETIGPGEVVEEGAILSLGSLASSTVRHLGPRPLFIFRQCPDAMGERDLRDMEPKRCHARSNRALRRVVAWAVQLVGQ